MTPEQFVFFMRGFVLDIETVPTEDEWVAILAAIEDIKLSSEYLREELVGAPDKGKLPQLGDITLKELEEKLTGFWEKAKENFQPILPCYTPYPYYHPIYTPNNPYSPQPIWYSDPYTLNYNAMELCSNVQS